MSAVGATNIEWLRYGRNKIRQLRGEVNLRRTEMPKLEEALRREELRYRNAAQKVEDAKALIEKNEAEAALLVVDCNTLEDGDRMRQVLEKDEVEQVELNCRRRITRYTIGERNGKTIAAVNSGF